MRLEVGLEPEAFTKLEKELGLLWSKMCKHKLEMMMAAKDVDRMISKHFVHEAGNLGVQTATSPEGFLGGDNLATPPKPGQNCFTKDHLYQMWKENKSTGKERGENEKSASLQDLSDGNLVKVAPISPEEIDKFFKTLRAELREEIAKIPNESLISDEYRKYMCTQNIESAGTTLKFGIQLDNSNSQIDSRKSTEEVASNDSHPGNADIVQTNTDSVKLICDQEHSDVSNKSALRFNVDQHVGDLKRLRIGYPPIDYNFDNEISEKETREIKKVQFDNITTNKLQLVLKQLSFKLLDLPSVIQRYESQESVNWTYVSRLVRNVSNRFSSFSDVLLMVGETPLSSLSPPSSLAETLATFASIDHFKKCFEVPSNSTVLNQNQLESCSIFNFKQLTGVEEVTLDSSRKGVTQIPFSGLDNAHNEIIEFSFPTYITDNELNRKSCFEGYGRSEVMKQFLILNVPTEKLESISNMFSNFSNVLAKAPESARSLNLLMLNPPKTLINVLDKLYAEGEVLGKRDCIESMTVQAASDVFQTMSKTFKDVLDIKRSSNTEISSDVTSSLLNAARVMSCLSPGNVAGSCCHSEDQESHVEPKDSEEEMFFDALESLETLNY